MSTFVTVGNATQAFDRLLRAVASVAQSLPNPIYVQHGASDYAMPGCHATRFLGMDEFALRVASATLLITHAGAGSLIHALDTGRIPIVMPRESRFREIVDDHQIELAEALAEEGRIILVRSEADMATAVRKALHEPPAPGGRSGDARLADLVAARLRAYAAR